MCLRYLRSCLLALSLEPLCKFHRKHLEKRRHPTNYVVGSTEAPIRIGMGELGPKPNTLTGRRVEL